MSLVRPLDIEQVLRLNLPHAVMLRVDDSWRPAWLLGHDRDSDGDMFLLQLLDETADAQPMWLSDVELGEVASRYGTETA